MATRITCTLLLFLTILNLRAHDITVAQDGSGDYNTIQEAFDAIPSFRKQTTSILIKNGVYKEKLILADTKKNVKITGEDRYKTIITYDDYAQKKNKYGEDIGTSGSASFFCIGDGFTAENITFENSSGPVGQAVTVWIGSDQALFINCRFLGYQDTLYTHKKGARQYYYKCYIEGTVDFIFGSSTAWFEQCEIRCKNNGYITAASTPPDIKYGYIFNHCNITGDASTGKFYLGRPWRPDAKTVFMSCNLPEFIRPEGWHNWGKESNEQTVFYAEYKNKGKGAATENRVRWSKQLTDTEHAELTLTKVFTDWEIPHNLR